MQSGSLFTLATTKKGENINICHAIYNLRAPPLPVLPCICRFLLLQRGFLSDLSQSKQGNHTAQHSTAHMHVAACLAGQKVDVEVGEGCRTIQALKEAIVAALPKLCVEGFDVSVGGRALDDDEGVVSLSEYVCLDVSANTRGLSVLALREAGREVSEDGLRLAAVQGDLLSCTLYLDAGVPIDCVNARGETPLHLSCMGHNLHDSCSGRHLEVARLLLDRGSTAIDEKNRCGLTPLFFSCNNGHLEIATLLLDRGSTAIDEKYRSGDTLLHVSCRGRLEVVRLLLDRGSTAIDEKNWCGKTPLHVSCSEGCLREESLEIVKLLLDRGSTAIDEKAEDGCTPLGASCFFGHLEIAILLLDRGSTAIDEKSRNGWTPLFGACWEGHLEIVTLLLDRGSTAMEKKDADEQTPLHVSCSEGHLEIATLLLDRGSTEIDEKNGRGETPLLVSCSSGHLEIATLLLDRGSTAIDEKSRNGWTPLNVSFTEGHLEVATLLLDRGCSVAVETYKAGSRSFRREALELLWERGHDVLPGTPPTCAKRRSKQSDQ